MLKENSLLGMPTSFKWAIYIDLINSKPFLVADL
jgi:hypothetical protein